MLIIKKEDFRKFVNELFKDYEVVVPIKTDEVRFEIVSSKSDLSKLNLEEHSLFPAKKFLFQKNKTMLEFDEKGVKEPVEPDFKRVILGLKKCDLNALKRQDKVFIEEIGDPYYKNQRENTILIGFQCKKSADEYCFCDSMNLEEYHDVMLYDKDKNYVLDVGSVIGEEFIKKYKKFFKESSQFITEQEKRVDNQLTLEKKEISFYFKSPEWENQASLCLSCASCVTLCPTCYCFDMCDRVDIADLNKVERIRNWASCQLNCFTEVAGGKVFREKRVDRFKHRIYHQLQYFREKHEINLCVGCGRCIRGCPTRINFVKSINLMK